MRGKKTSFSDEALNYLAEHSRQDEILARVERETAERPDSEMQISPDQGALLTLLVRLIDAKDVLELGTYTGYSAICLARGLGDGGRLTCLELDEDLARIAQGNLDDAGVADRVDIRIGPAEQSLEAMPEEPAFDLVFLDADKPGYPAYYELLLPRMRRGALLLVDNILFGGRALDPDTDSGRAIAELNDRIAADERVDAAFVLVADGIAFVRKR